MIKVYPASCVHHASYWRMLEEVTKGIILSARWVRHIEVGTQETPGTAREFWSENIQDIEQSDALVLYAESGDVLGGALVEVGVALAYGVPVFTVGSNPSFRSWTWHPLVQRCNSMNEAIAAVQQVTPRRW